MRFSALDGARGCCALFVALFHFNYFWHFYGTSFVRNSYLFVDFFFVLSGFVISAGYGDSLGKTVSSQQFMLRRFGRLWPLHAAILIVLVLHEIAKLTLHTGKPAFTGDTSLASLFFNLLLLHGLGVNDRLTWNHPSWTISAEFAAYLVFMIVTIGWRERTVIAFALLAAASFCILLLRSPHGMDATYDFGVYRGLYGFSVGCLTYRFYRRRPRWNAWAQGVSACLALGFITVAITKTTLLAPLAFMPLVYSLASDRGHLARLLQRAPLQALGAWSYSIYMLQCLVLTLLQETLSRVRDDMTVIPWRDVYGRLATTNNVGSAWMMDGLLLFYLLALVMAASLSYRMFEMPCRRLFNRMAAALPHEYPAQA